MLGSLVSQLLRELPASAPVMSRVSEMIVASRSQTIYPSFSRLLEVFSLAAEEFSRTFIVIDALDEITDRDRIVELLTDLPGRTEHFKVFVSSRREADLENAFARVSDYALTSAHIAMDIERFVRAQLARPRWRNVPNREEIVHELVSQADGMYESRFPQSP